MTRVVYKDYAVCSWQPTPGRARQTGGPRASARQPDSSPRLDAVDARLFEVAAGLGAIAVDGAAVVFALRRVSETAASRACGRRHAANDGAASVFSVADDALGVQPQERVARGDLDGVVGLAAACAAGQAVQRRGERRASGSERRHGLPPMAAATVYRRASTADVVPHASPALAAGGTGLRPQRIPRGYWISGHCPCRPSSSQRSTDSAGMPSSSQLLSSP